MQTVAMGWLMLELGGTPFDLGLINFAQLVPILALGVVGGAVSDRVNKRWLLIAAQSGAAVINLLIALLTLAGLITIPTLIVLAFISGLASPFVWPAFQAIIRELVGPEELRKAIALNAGRFNLARILGPTIAGGLVAIIGTAGCLIIGSDCPDWRGVDGLAHQVRPSTPRSPVGMGPGDDRGIATRLARPVRSGLICSRREG